MTGTYVIRWTHKETKLTGILACTFSRHNEAQDTQEHLTENGSQRYTYEVEET